MNSRAIIKIFIAVLASLSVLSACSGGEQAQDDTGAAQKRDNVARAGDSEARAGDGAGARAGRDKARKDGGEKPPERDAKDRSRGVALKIGGDPGTKFHGTCTVGGEEKSIGGQVPARYHYKPSGGELECEIRKRSAGTLEVVLAAGNNVRSVQQTNARGGIIQFAYSSNGISSSTLESSS